MNTASDQSNVVFTVAPKAPESLILTPENLQRFGLGEFVQFEGIATDVEDGPLADSQLTWTSDRQGVIGQGTAFNTDGLLPGLHTITLTAIDSNGMSSSDSIQVIVGGRLYIPTVRK